MKHKKLLLISAILTAVLYVVLVTVTLFRVSDVNVNYSVYSFEDYAVCEDILASYKGKSLVMLDAEEIALKITQNTNLKVRSIKKDYPFTLTLDLYSGEERFAVADGDSGYYVLDSDYVVLKKRDTFINPADGLSDLLLIFDTEAEPVVTLKKPLFYENQTVFDSLKTVVSAFDSPRDSLYSVRVIETEEKGNYRMELSMRSGVKILVFKATEKTKEKVLCGISKYRSLSDSDLITGKIECLERSTGEVTAVYTRY